MNAVSEDLKYRRVLLKLSGEALMGGREFGLETETVGRIAGEVKSVLDLGCEVCLVIGGGNIFRGIEAASQGFAVPDQVSPIPTAEYPTIASRPLYSVLDCSKIKNEFGIFPSDWREGVKNVLLKMKCLN